MSDKKFWFQEPSYWVCVPMDNRKSAERLYKNQLSAFWAYLIKADAICKKGLVNQKVIKSKMQRNLQPYKSITKRTRGSGLKHGFF